MIRLLAESRGDSGRPQLGEDLQRAHVEIPVMEVALQLRHLARKEAAVLANAVAGHWRCARVNPVGQELERRQLRLTRRHFAGKHPLGQP